MTKEQRNEMIDQRITEYEHKLFALRMDKTALEAVGDTEGVSNTDQRIKALELAVRAVEAMKE